MAKFTVKVQPRSSRNAVIRQPDGSWKIRLQAPPVDGAANAELVRFLAKQLGIPKSSVRIVSGQGSRIKTIEIQGYEENQINQRLAR